MALAFYVSAHQDDWQLFRGRQARLDVRGASNRVVLIYTTAGNINSPDGSNLDGWPEARELGAIESCRYLTGPSPVVRGATWIRNHPIRNCVCGNTVSYFMYLPDAGPDGLRMGATGVPTMDGLTIYANWTDFVQTLRGIFESERIAYGQEQPWINAPDVDPVRNPGDHPAHIASGHAVFESAARDYKIASWIGYCSLHMAINVTGEDETEKRRLFLAYNDKAAAEMEASGHHLNDYRDTQGSRDFYDNLISREYAS